MLRYVSNNYIDFQTNLAILKYRLVQLLRRGSVQIVIKKHTKFHTRVHFYVPESDKKMTPIVINLIQDQGQSHIWSSPWFKQI